MVRKTSKAAVRPHPKRPPIRLGEIKTGRLVNRLRELHELGGDPAFERFPASEELFLVLDHAQTWAGKLKQPKDSLVSVVGEAAVLRAKFHSCLALSSSAPAPRAKAITVRRVGSRPSRARRSVHADVTGSGKWLMSGFTVPAAVSSERACGAVLVRVVEPAG
ncbi:hypothetical protein [Streptomyces sp. NPDC101165]|uniref:hypothetical protein n=1 Tax=Streptomyces sp. NPDC101165 TaxID=3366119 RepID=UPI0038232FD4